MVLVEEDETTSRIGIVLSMVAVAEVSTRDVMEDTTITTKGIAGTEDVAAAVVGEVKEEAAPRGTTSMNVDSTAEVTSTESTVTLVVLVMVVVIVMGVVMVAAIVMEVVMVEAIVMEIVTDMDAVAVWGAINGVAKNAIVTQCPTISILHTTVATTGTTTPTTHLIVTTATLDVETIVVCLLAAATIATKGAFGG